MSDRRKELIARMNAFVDRAEQRRKLGEEDRADIDFFERELGELGAQPIIEYLMAPTRAPTQTSEDEPYTD